jgi:hypothetical protein
VSKSKKVATPVADRGWAVFGEAAYAAPIVDASGVTVNQGRLGSDQSKVVKKEDRVSKPARKSKKVAEVIENGAGVVEAFEVALGEVVKQTRAKKEKVKKEVALKKFSVKVTMVQTVVVEVEAKSRKEAKTMVKQLEDIKVDASKSTVRKFRVLRDTK